MLDSFSNIDALLGGDPSLFFLILVWSLVWKGIALWKAARNSHQKWFIVLLISNTLAILEIVYIFYFSKKKTEENSNF